MPPVVKSPNSSSSESPKVSKGGGVELTSGGNAILHWNPFKKKLFIFVLFVKITNDFQFM